MSKRNDEKNETTISVLVADDRSTLETKVKSFLFKLDQSGETVIGVDVEWSPYYNQAAKPISVAFCGGGHCLFVLLQDNHSHESLLTFLRDPKLTFVGMGIKEDLSALVKVCGIRFRNAVELGSLAATYMDDSLIDGCGLDMLERSIKLPKIQKPTFTYADPYANRSVGVSGTLTTIASNCYTYYKIGKHLLDS